MKKHPDCTCNFNTVIDMEGRDISGVKGYHHEQRCIFFEWKQPEPEVNQEAPQPFILITCPVCGNLVRLDNHTKAEYLAHGGKGVYYEGTCSCNFESMLNCLPKEERVAY